MTDSEKRPDDEEIDPYGEAFGDVEWEDPELTSESRRLLDSVMHSLRSRPRDNRHSPKPSELAEDAREIAARDATVITERLVDLEVRGVRTAVGVDQFTYRHIQRYPELDMVPHLIDDVHYEVYRKRKEKSPSPYLTISLDDVLSELVTMQETSVDPVNYQRRQLNEAVEFLQRLSIEEGSIYEAMAKPDGRFMVRSLHRFLSERSMRSFLENFKKVQKERMDERPVDLISVAARAVKWFEIRYRENQALGGSIDVEGTPKWQAEFATEKETILEDTVSDMISQTQKKQLDEKDPDQMHWYEMRMRELNRTKALARPISEYVGNGESA
jgi:hypothetical protein